MAFRERMQGAAKVGQVQPLRKAPRGSGARALSHVALFEGLRPRDLRKIAALAEEVWFAPGAVVVEEGTHGLGFYAILDGTAKVTRSRAGRALRTLRPGDHFGELALLDGRPRSATVTAQTSLDVIRIRRPAFRKLLLAEPEVGLRIMERLAMRFREFEDRALG
jgi:CRP/FNR family cyclic AMP-dependent transcriptional regulator